MLKRLEADAIKADIASIDALLDKRTEEDDPIGWLQFQSRREHLLKVLREMESTHETSASLGVFFGGRPVIGSKGIVAEFGAKAVEHFQDLVSIRYASLNGPLGERGPVPQRERAQLMITDIARGSVGFVLEEIEPSEQLVDTSLKRVVDDVCDLIFRLASPDTEGMQQVTEAIDNRLLNELRSFLKQIDDAGATMRLVDEQRDVVFDRDAIERARERTEALELSEHTVAVTGTLYILPESRRFELHPEDGSETKRGSVTKDCLGDLLGTNFEIPEGIIGRIQSVTMRVKEVRSPNQPIRRSYTLTSMRPDS